MQYAVYLAPADLSGTQFPRSVWVARSEDFTLTATVEAESPSKALVLGQNGKNTFGWADQWVQREDVLRRHVGQARSLRVGDVFGQLGRYHTREKDIVIRRDGTEVWEPRRDNAQDIRDRQEHFLSHPEATEPATL